MPSAPQHTISLGHGLFVDYGFSSSTELDYDLRFEQREVVHGSVSVGTPSGPVGVSTDLVRGQLEITIEPLSGVVGLIATIEVREPGVEPPTWKTVVNFTEPHITMIDPTKGFIAGAESGYPPQVLGYGPNGPSGGGDVTRFHISDDERLLADVGRIVKQRLFAATGPLTLNILACVGLGADPGKGPGVYADPESPWFNVFFGIYQVDCAKADGWTRPFGYEAAQGVGSVVHGEDLVRIGTADWNWFSNYLYGVPEEICIEYSTVDMGAVSFQPPPTVLRCGNSNWHQVSMSGVKVASAYQSNAPGAQQLVKNSLLTPTWQETFGLPCPRPEYTTSFIPTVLRSALFMAYTEDDSAFHTLMFGGTAGIDTDAGFLTAQADAAVATITKHYPSAGFPLG